MKSAIVEDLKLHAIHCGCFNCTWLGLSCRKQYGRDIVLDHKLHVCATIAHVRLVHPHQSWIDSISVTTVLVPFHSESLAWAYLLYLIKAYEIGSEFSSCRYIYTQFVRLLSLPKK